MTTLFDQEQLTESYGQEKYDDGLEVGLAAGEARQFIDSVDVVMKIYNVPIEKACKDFGKTIDDYNKAKKFIENIKAYDIAFAKMDDDLPHEKEHTNEAVRELFDKCKEENILQEYLTDNESEAFSIMSAMFEQKQANENFGIRKYNEGLESGRKKGEARQFVDSVDSMTNVYNVSIEKACKDYGKTIDDYNKAKKLLEGNKTYP